MAIANEQEVPSPALLLYPDRIDENLRRMVAIAGDPGRLWPHIKTHKLPQLVTRQIELGITKCKCATIAEAEMAAGAGASEVLLAQQPVGPNVARLIELTRLFPEVQFSTLIDDATALGELAAGTDSASLIVLLDLDVGMGRTGISPGPQALALYRQLCAEKRLRPGGLHAYDGHLYQRDAIGRAAACEEAFAPVRLMREELEREGFPVPRIIAGGTPTFAIHAAHPEVECSPGTAVLWDAGYSAKVPDLPFQPAAVLLTRVVSKPGGSRICLDLGHKAVASEMPPPRAIFPALPDARAIAHSEEHLVIESARAGELPIGMVLYAIPWHVCPTVALHSEAWIVKGGRAEERWPIVARARRLTV